MKPSVIISLVVYNGEAYIERCLHSIAAQTYTDFSLVIVDNASHDQSRGLITSLAPHAKTFFFDKNIGFSRAHNHVIRSTSSDLVFILNTDCVLEPHYLEYCVEKLVGDPFCGSVCGSLVRMDRLTKSTHNDTIDTLGLCIHKTFHVGNLGSGKPISSVPTAPFSVFGVSATAALYRRAALDDISIRMNGSREYFDEDFFLYKEDVDVAFRLYRKGWNSWCVPEARGAHVRSTVSTLFERANPMINMLSYRNHFLFLMKSLTRDLIARYGIHIFFYEIAKFLYISVREPSSLRGVYEAWKMRKKILRKRMPETKKDRELPFGCNISFHAG